MASAWNAFVQMVLHGLLILTCLSQVVLVNGESEVLTEDNCDMIFKGHWMVKFYAPWCPACRNLRPIWDKFAVKAETLNVRVAEVDVTKNTALSGRFGITSLPTVYQQLKKRAKKELAINGELRLYQEKRKLGDMVAFIEERKWENIEAIPSWKSPNSIIMRALGVVFKLSVLLKDTHTVLTETYGLPAWGSYVVFGVATVVIGLIIGVVLVFLTDYFIGVFWPAPAHSGPPSDEQNVPDSNQSEETKEDTDEDKEIDEAIEPVETASVRKRGKKLKATVE